MEERLCCRMDVAVYIVVFMLICRCAGDASADLAKLHSDFFTWRMSDRPMVATYRDVHKYDDQLEAFTLDMFDVRKTRADELHARLKNITVADLKKSDLTNLRILDDMLSTYIAGYPWRMYQYLTPVNFLEGPQQEASSLAEVLPFSTRGDFENYIVRLQKTPGKMSQYKTLMRIAIQLNRTNHLVSMNRLREQFAKLNVSDPTQSVLYLPFNNTLAKSNISDGDRAGLRQRGSAAVALAVQAYMDLSAFIQQEYLPNTRPDIGISSLDGGQEYYEACIRWYLSVNMTAQEVHDIGLREVDRIVDNMQKIMTKQRFNGSVSEYFQMLTTDPRFTFTSASDILEEYRHQIHDIIQKTLPKLFVNMPTLPIVVRPLSFDGPVGMYSTGAADGSRPGIFWANVLRPNQTVNFTTMVLTLHEASPGHHLQLSYSITADTPNFRQKMEFNDLFRAPFAFPGYTSYVEGWGLYAESLGEELGVYRDDYELMGRYSFEILRACRLVVDTGMHAMNWSRDEAIQYLQNYTAESLNNIIVEIDRYITWPGQALAYKIGEIKIRELRQRAEKRLGDKFDIREFHSVVLESGTVPLNVLEDLVTDWLDTYPVTTPRPETPTCGGTHVMVRHLWIVLATSAAVTVSGLY
ncbi:uncharacterized protein LOC124119515 isoform X1 [Haliotis rufescens]|uniref:uncharacterized protein LOC124119515 isoform X1 n=3 Tax=Haliotis rufescens TaxID=6454 RepID=UPI00201EB6D3|nr:uncharacterized protein LOC124119515 isoform X1 [Haliotis rufescens]